jgi:hypothetical protein
MKKYIYLLFFIPLFGYCQTIPSDKNAIIHSKLRVATTNEADASDPSKAVIAIAYSDGLGRGLQTVGYQQSPTNKDIVSGAVEFDKFGRVIRTALPAPTTDNTGTYQANAFSLANGFYGDSYAYSATTSFDNSPLNRVREQYGAGNAWRSNTKRMQNFDESAGEDVRKYYLNGSGDIILSGTYPSNSLYKKRNIDEQGHTSIIISDKRGRLIQKQLQDDNGYATTYYLYDGMGRILAVIQPEGYELNASISKNSSEWLKWVFSYEYDYRGRMHLKHVPASGDEYFIYDKWDRLVWSQTPIQREFGKWSFYKYDAFNREIMRGEKSESRGLSALETEVQAWSGDRYESRTTGGIYYSYSNSYPQLFSDTDIRHVNYYDNYNNWLPSGMAFADGGTAFHAQHPEAQGLMVGSRSRSDTDNNWLVSVSYYDNKGRVIRSFAHNGFGQIEMLDTEYNHAGESLQVKKIHKNQTGTATTEQSQNELDHVGRVKKLFHGINVTPIEIVRNDYDEIGRLSQKKIFPNNTFVAGGTKEFIERPSLGIVTQANTVDLARRYVLLEPTTNIKAIDLNSYLAHIDPNASQGVNINGLQTMNFAWHLRGGLLGINLDNSGNANPKASEGDLFSYKLDFETAGLYDGNIGKQYWQGVNDQNQAIGLRSYSMTYDPLKRMTGASFTGIGGENYSIPNISYDRNGNINNLQRKGKSNGTYTDIDNLSYNYNGNQLVGVTDGINGNEDVGDFRDNGSNSDYTYWTDGSLKSDANKGITLIEYNTFLKKVKQINIGSNWIKFFYDGSGGLIRRSNSLGDVWDYCPNGMIYKNGQPYQLSTPEGRAVYVAGQWIYEFEYRDIWGNLRVAFKANGNQLEATQKNDYDITGFELKPLAYENVATKNNFKFQNQERIDDLGLDIDFFKFRLSDSKIVRFWQSDPLASDYPHNSPYALQENKFGLGFELEGAEVSPFEMHQARQQIERNKTTMTPQQAQRYENNGRAVGVLAVGGMLTTAIVLATSPALAMWALSNPVAATETGGAVLGGAAGAMGYDGNDIVPGSYSDDAGLKAGQGANKLLSGSGPRGGIIEISDRVKSTKAFENYNPKKAVDFVYNAEKNSMAVATKGTNPQGHTSLAQSIGAGESVVGGRLVRGAGGAVETSEWSGHYGQNWTPEIRKSFTNFLGEKTGLQVNHSGNLLFRNGKK